MDLSYSDRSRQAANQSVQNQGIISPSFPPPPGMPKPEGNLYGAILKATGYLQDCHSVLSRMEDAFSGPQPAGGSAVSSGPQCIAAATDILLQTAAALSKRLAEFEAKL